MSYTALSHGGVARVSTMVVDAPLDMGGFAVKTPTIEEAVAGAGVLIDEPRRSYKWVAAPGATLRYQDATVHTKIIPDYTTPETVVLIPVPDRYLPGSRVNIQMLGKGIYPNMDVTIGTNTQTITTAAGTDLFFDDVAIEGGVSIDVIGSHGFGGTTNWLSVEDIKISCVDTTVGTATIHEPW